MESFIWLIFLLCNGSYQSVPAESLLFKHLGRFDASANPCIASARCARRATETSATQV